MRMSDDESEKATPSSHTQMHQIMTKAPEYAAAHILGCHVFQIHPCAVILKKEDDRHCAFESNQKCTKNHQWNNV